MPIHVSTVKNQNHITYFVEQLICRLCYLLKEHRDEYCGICPPGVTNLMADTVPHIFTPQILPLREREALPSVT